MQYFSPQAVKELHVMEKAVVDIVDKAYAVFANQDIQRQRKSNL